ncbi:cytochrome P450 [Ophiocordyceps sinensis CO18]|uniref:Cytochrome P450 n=1 Tax=Ophiocordyceps sinensis (strain Co18 / CGMCC 3.14243) TaxID=911162 RepID=T5AD35_OPHSC|nr:cytochrome P450 [Ophiocordyceps sinensis CO18]
MALFELLGAVAWVRVAGYSVLLLVACFIVDFAMLPPCPEQIPLFGFGRGVWAHVRNSLAYFTSHKAWVEEGYAKRISNFADTLIERVVVAPRGLRHPDFAWTLPPGAFVTVNLEGTHHDDDLYANARAYDPLRFAPMREGESGGGRRDELPRTKKEEATAPRALGMVTTSDCHLAFGHGRHACPGRFFVAHELKLIMAHLLLNYDIKSLPQRPQPRWIAPPMPPLGARIEIRRKTRPELVAGT